MLKNAPTVAIRGVDTAENEPSKAWEWKEHKYEKCCSCFQLPLINYHNLVRTNHTDFYHVSTCIHIFFFFFHAVRAGSAIAASCYGSVRISSLFSKFLTLCDSTLSLLGRLLLLLNICKKVGLAAELTLRVSESVSLRRFESQRVR